MIEPNPAQAAALDQMVAGVRANLTVVIDSAAQHLSGKCPVVGSSSRELVIAHLAVEIEESVSADACFEMLAMCVVELAEQREADSV